MRTLVALVILLTSGVGSGTTLTGQDNPTGPNLTSPDTPFLIHNIRPAQEVTLGAGVKVGILDHSFEVASHPELYAGRKEFRVGARVVGESRETYRGYWTALTLHEVAPGAEIYALDLPAPDGRSDAEAMARALAWAVENGLDVVTYCGGDLSPEDREILDPAVEKAVRAGVVVVFAGYAHPSNLLPGSFGPVRAEDGRAPDLNIFSYDCTAVIADEIVAFMDVDDDVIRRRRPFLSRSSVAPVAAGFVALVRSVDPEATPGEIKNLLMESSRPLEHKGRVEPRVPDVFEAIKSVSGMGAGRPD